ncbi:MAG: hypothetical protein F4Y87_06415 [Synechococcus sp. SB0665_bin_28]|nr:hypothetical protein [Synechococcus sp. SB0665_bin_28]MYF19870.1 hypothetical protein [Synechococcus sp. SB0677_bin_5]
MTHNSNARHQAGGILVLLAPCCWHRAPLLPAWIVGTGIPGSFSGKQRRRMLAAASPKALILMQRIKSGRLPVEFMPSDSPYAALNVYGQLHEARF